MRKLVCVGMLCALLSACTSPFEKQVKADFQAKKGFVLTRGFLRCVR